MYTILAYRGPRTKNYHVVYDVAQEIYVDEAKLTLKDSTKIDDLSITVNQKNWLFNNFQAFKTHVEVYQDGKLIFRGRGLKPTNEMKDSGLFTRSYSFESIKAYLLDSVQRFYINNNMTATELLKHILKWHNKDVSVSHQVWLKKNEFEKSKTTHYVKIDYSTTWDALNSILIKKFGGQLNFKYDKKTGKNYLDYIDTKAKGYEDTLIHNEPVLAIGQNLKSISQSMDPSGVVTRLVPLGAEKKAKKVKLGADYTVDEDNVTVTGATHKIHGSWASAVKHAARLMNVNLTSAELKTILWRIQKESGGREHAINNWDSNAKAGHPSKGLLQFIDTTFKTYCLPGFTNIYKGFDQLLALFNIEDWYSAISVKGGWGPNNRARRYSKIPRKYASKKHMKTLNKWGWPFPSVGEGHFMSKQLFGYHQGNGRRNNFHDGLDFGSVDHPGSAIHAIHGGTVIEIGYMGGIKWYVLTHSTDGYDIVYQEAFSSKSKIAVKVGQTFKRGHIIGYRDTNHLHIGICKKPYKWTDGVSHSFTSWHWLDPLKLIKHGGQKGDKASSAKYYKKSSKLKGRVTIKSVNKGKDYVLADKDMIDKFGYIAKTVVFDSVKKPEDLLKKAKAYLAKQKKDFLKESCKISALELPNSQSFPRFEVGQKYPTSTQGLVMSQDQYLMITQKEIDIANSPYNSSLEVGDQVAGITNYQVELNKSFTKKIANLENLVIGITNNISSIGDNADSLEDTVNSNAERAKANDDQSRFSTKILRRDFNKYKKKTDKRLKKDEKNIKALQEAVKKLETSLSNVQVAVTALQKGGKK